MNEKLTGFDINQPFSETMAQLGLFQDEESNLTYLFSSDGTLRKSFYPFET